jgi:hypothetical protein
VSEQHAADGRPSADWRSVGGGLLVGGAGALFGLCLNPRRRLDLAALELAFIAGAYPAIAFQGSPRRALLAEFAASGLFITLAATGLARRSRLVVAAGLAAHAAWDGVHHAGHPGTRTPSWLPSFCMTADLLLAAQFARATEAH